MIFKETLEDLKEKVDSSVSELFEAAKNNQSHPQDLLLIDQHGFFNADLDTEYARNELKVSPYSIGPDLIGFSDSTFYEFINWYRNSHLFSKKEFLDELEKNDAVKEQERLTIQVEQGIYLRFWESDFILKQLHQLSSLASGRPYNWKLKIPVHLREGSKHEIIRSEIRDRIKNICPNFFALVKDNYKTQIRNAIAHSQFSILGRGISLLNYSSDPKAFSPIQSLSFDSWYELFHTMLLLHNAIIKEFRLAREVYKTITLENKNKIEVRIVDGQNESYSDLGILHNRDDWVWHQSLNEADLSQSNI